MPNLNSFYKVKKTKNKDVILIDGMNLFHRQYHIFGEYPMGTAYGIMNTIIKISNDCKTNKFIICWDGNKNWRSDNNSDYKLTRKIQRDKEFSEEQKMNFNQSLLMSRKLLKEVGIIQVLNDKYEADDVIAYYVQAIDNNVIIVSNDKDFAQLVNDKKSIRVMKPLGKGKYEFLDEAGVKKFYGVCPNDIPKFLAIAGDVSDNVKGVWRMGKVKAMKLINNGEIIKKNLKTVFNKEQLKQFVESYKLVKLGNDFVNKIEIMTSDLILKNDLLSYRNKKTYIKEVQKILSDFEIKRFRAFEIQYLFNYKFINEIIKMSE